MSVLGRAAVRDEFASLLLAGLTGNGKPVQAVYQYQVGDFAGQSPVVALGSGGTLRAPLTMRGGHAKFYLEVFIFVLYAALDYEGKLQLDINGLPIWNEADSQDALDEIERLIAELVDTHQRGRNWIAVDYAAKSEVDAVAVGGLDYRREVIPLVFS